MKLSYALFAVLFVTSLSSRVMGAQAPSEQPVAGLDLTMNSPGAPVFEVDHELADNHILGGLDAVSSGTNPQGVFQ